METIFAFFSPQIGEKFNQFQNLNGNMNKLKRKIEDLHTKRDDIITRTEIELRPRKKLKSEVAGWLKDVQEATDKIPSIEARADEANSYSLASLSNSLSPANLRNLLSQASLGNLRISLSRESLERLVREKIEEMKKLGQNLLTRASVGKLVADMVEEVTELCQKGNTFPDSLVIDVPPPIGETLATTTLAAQSAAERKMEEIFACLTNDNIKRIGVSGMGGVGKTTIMKNINNRLIVEADRFDRVIWATVSKSHDVIRLQKDIAKALGIDLREDEDKTRRAAKLLEELHWNKRFVLILDDVWETFALEDVGIPEPTGDNGCKLVLTTRLQGVAQLMDCEVIKVESLKEEEAEELFLNKVGRDILGFPNLQPTMQLVVKQCAGLPLAIVTIAASMKGVRNIHVWRNALYELRGQTRSAMGMVNEVLDILKFSYDRLGDQKVQHCFLYCSLWPEDFEIRKVELIEHWIAEGLVSDETDSMTMQEQYDRGHAILYKLESNCLLESGHDGLYVKMHDLIRDMALRITNPQYMVKSGMELEEFPAEQEWRNDVKKVSLMRSRISNFANLDMSPNCPMLSTLLLQGILPLFCTIPESFFVHMHGLEVLNLSGNPFMDYLPDSISELENLTALFLSNCRSLLYVPCLSKLRKLKRLDLRSTGIRKVPQGMEMLAKLKYLDLDDIFPLQEIPVGILPKLSCLQYLRVGRGSDTLKIEGEEVMGLRKLESFKGRLSDLHDFCNFVKFLQVGRGLREYHLQVGIVFRVSSNKYPKKCVELNGCGTICGEDTIDFPTDIQELSIEDCHDMTSLSNFSSLKVATDLRKCRICNCEGMESFVSLSSHFGLLCRIEILYLDRLKNLSVVLKVSAAGPPPGTFSYLRSLHVCGCPKIKKLLWPGLLSNLQKLEEIHVLDCEQIEEIVASEEEQSGNHAFSLPKLTLLTLWDLPELKRICGTSLSLVCESLVEIIFRCPKLTRIPVSSPPCFCQNKSLEWGHPDVNLLPRLLFNPTSGGVKGQKRRTCKNKRTKE